MCDEQCRVDIAPSYFVKVNQWIGQEARAGTLRHRQSGVDETRMKGRSKWMSHLSSFPLPLS